MPTRISAGVGDHFFPYFHNYNLQITNFSATLFACFLKDYHHYFLARTKLLICRKPLARMLLILSFSAHYKAL